MMNTVMICFMFDPFLNPSSSPLILRGGRVGLLNFIKRQIQFQDIDPWLTQNPEMPLFNIGSHKGANHGFNNNTGGARYHKEAADLAWSRTVAFFKKHLGA